MIECKWLLRTRMLSGRLHWFFKLQYEKSVRRRLRQIRGELFWDIGANIGFYSLFLRRNISKIVAVEPNPETATTLRRRTQGTDNIAILELALSNTNGPT